MILVTGSNGMVGSAVVAQLLERGETFRTLDRKENKSDHYESVLGDIRDLDSVRKAMTGIDGVIHTASLVDLHLGKPQYMYDTNVTGVENMITACHENGVHKFSHMSSGEAIAGTEPLINATEAESTYPRPHLTYYGVTKEGGERQVLAASSDKLATCAFRTFGIYGERDRNFVSFARKKALKNKQIPLIGGNTGLTDINYAGNVAHALIEGYKQVEIGNDISGQAFHITEHAPGSVQDFVINMLKPLGYKEASFGLSMGMAKGLVTMFESLYNITKAERFAYPVITNHQMLLASQDYYLDSSKLRNLLSWSPKYSREEAVKRTQAWYLSQE